MLTGRYPWAAGFYSMADDEEHCTTNSTALPELLKPFGYKTHALGKWDVGFMKKECSPTYRGFDTFFGYYLACEADYWYHAAPVRLSLSNFTTCSPTCCDNGIGDQPVKCEIPAGTKNVLDGADGLLRPSSAIHRWPLDAVACCSLLLLTCALLVTSSHSKANRPLQQFRCQHTTGGSGAERDVQHTRARRRSSTAGGSAQREAADVHVFGVHGQ